MSPGSDLIGEPGRTTRGGPGELIARLQQRDEQALAELYDLVAARAYGLAYRVLRDGAAAEDVVQEAFVTVWEQADRLDPARGSLEGFVLTVTHRRAVDAVRARMRRPQVSDDASAVERVEDGGRPVADVVTDSIEFEQATEALDGLPAEQREVVTLAYFDGLTHAEIADHLGVPIGTVKSRLRLALARLRDRMGIVQRT
ncbi:MAG: sigma-70 family RNA polymerase sigma factor [Dehalococcoidia bacterium]|nr:sigma-70 family RNA polymerase sigma factor [Dehalococcoidia bacterium]